METKKKEQKVKGKSQGISSGLVLLVCGIIAFSIWNWVFGDPTRFVDNDPTNHPLPGDYLATIYKGGPVVVLIITLMLTVITLSIERLFAIGKSKGKGDIGNFVANVKHKLESDDIDGAQELCSKQKGSIAAIISAGLIKYKQMETTTENITKEQKLLSIQKEIEEATALELPTMEQNLPIIATISTLGTLFGLLGTVIGMIRSFSALANAGSPDSVALSAGISEALINTALGIGTGALAIISYSYFTGRIDKMMYAIDEMGFSIVQTYASKHN